MVIVYTCDDCYESFDALALVDYVNITDQFGRSLLRVVVGPLVLHTFLQALDFAVVAAVVVLLEVGVVAAVDVVASFVVAFALGVVFVDVVDAVVVAAAVVVALRRFYQHFVRLTGDILLLDWIFLDSMVACSSCDSLED
jgi:hypothetical protein